MSEPDRQGTYIASLVVCPRWTEEREGYIMDTIKAKEGYRVCVLKRHGELYAQASWWFDEEECTHLRALLDGDRVVMVACLIPLDEYKREKEQNEMFHFCERFTTRKGNHFIYWRDEETDKDYITKEEMFK